MEGPLMPGAGRNRSRRWVRPVLRWEVTCQEEMPSGHLRVPVFMQVVP